MLDRYDLIRNIEKRPAMYLGSQTFRIKSAFLSGYFFACRQSGIPETLHEQQFFEFQAWVKRKVNLPHSQP